MKTSISNALAELREAIFEEMTKILRTKKGRRAELSRTSFIREGGIETAEVVFLDEDGKIEVVSVFVGDDGRTSECEEPIALLSTDELLSICNELDV